MMPSCRRELLTNRTRYLDKLNFATNFAFFRDANGLSTRLVSANYWAGYGAGADPACGCGCSIRRATRWRPGSRKFQPGPCGFSIDSRVVRERFGLPDFTGQLFVHAIGVAGHDVVKYALDTYAARQWRAACPARMTPTPGRPTVTPACRRRERMSG